MMLTPPPPPAPPPPPDAPRKRGPGRPPGRKNDATLIKEAAARAALEAITPDGGPASATALTLLQHLYRDARLPIELRMKAASLAAPLEVPRPVAPPPPKDDAPLAKALNEAFKRVGRRPFAEPEERVLSADDEAALREMLGLVP